MLCNARRISVGTGYERVDSDVMCVITRFQVRSVWGLLRFYRSFRHVRAESRDVSGLIASLFLVENLHTCYTLSIWRDETAILQFNTRVVAHVHAANACFGDLDIVDRRPRLWSAQFRLFAVSSTNLRWQGVDLTSAPGRTAPTTAAQTV